MESRAAMPAARNNGRNERVGIIASGLPGVRRSTYGYPPQALLHAVSHYYRDVLRLAASNFPKTGYEHSLCYFNDIEVDAERQNEQHTGYSFARFSMYVRVFAQQAVDVTGCLRNLVAISDFNPKPRQVIFSARRPNNLVGHLLCKSFRMSANGRPVRTCRRCFNSSSLNGHSASIRFISSGERAGWKVPSTRPEWSHNSTGAINLLSFAETSVSTVIRVIRSFLLTEVRRRKNKSIRHPVQL